MAVIYFRQTINIKERTKLQLWRYMKKSDKRSIEQFNRKFRSDYSIEELEIKFDKEISKGKII